MTLPALKGGVSSVCKVWILCVSIPPTNKVIPGPNALKGGVCTRRQNQFTTSQDPRRVQ
jgi:hypothetical protein